MQDIPNGSPRQSEPLPDNHSIRTYGGNGREYWAAWSSDSQLFAVDADAGHIAVFRRDGKFMRYLTGHNGTAHAQAAQFAPHGATRLGVACADHTLRVWDVDTGRQQHVGVQLTAEQAAILNDQGEMLFGESAAVEKELIYMVEYNDGRTAVLRPSQWKTLRDSGTRPAAAAGPPEVKRLTPEPSPAKG